MTGASLEEATDSSPSLPTHQKEEIVAYKQMVEHLSAIDEDIPNAALEDFINQAFDAVTSPSVQAPVVAPAG